MSKLKLGDDDKFPQFETDVGEALAYLQKCPNRKHYKTMAQILADNIKMFKHIKEIENGNTINGKESSSFTSHDPGGMGFESDILKSGHSSPEVSSTELHVGESKE
jgi:3-deoxy-D-arabino-heptulosonate 7-phosphate (DAHP) synthase class II